MPNLAVPQGAITSLVTPFRSDLVDQRGLELLVDRQVLGGVDGLLVCDPTGEGTSLSEDERDAVVRTAVAAARNRVPVIAATGTNSTSTTIEQTLHAAELGAAAALVTVPYYSKPGQRGIVHHFEEVATRTKVPIIVDVDPNRTASPLGLSALTELANMPNIVGLKHCDGDIASFAAMPPGLKHRFIQYGGHDLTALAFLIAGGSSVISRTSNITPQLVSSMQKAASGQNICAALLIQKRLAPLVAAIGDSGAPTIKHALSLMTGCSADVRLPLVPAEPEECHAIAAALAPYLASETTFNIRRHAQIWA
ncbi:MULTISPECIES: 4-hydroxy-tetrahydrodipicolinate synthase [unclassified Rhizobium]|uniref:4-hydroxy-tetrahydrodipicolinate synthase n=1 Tax=unclassified Rhizobium TaxID=2613769 RepID=UPI00104A8B04|nr:MULTISPECIES: 4-hydroxy-tetrahydrodipicolinate synthase [unclassified Rhizobium]MBB3399429.1 4-hydroxy-tetrahydrodipicolinate synthase [Rhizobium sp. BK060]MBB4167716.1 4-hydroxy-tetrahydrodipicolinate synthase [Rhizobium sp. BK538]